MGAGDRARHQFRKTVSLSRIELTAAPRDSSSCSTVPDECLPQSLVIDMNFCLLGIAAMVRAAIEQQRGLLPPRIQGHCTTSPRTWMESIAQWLSA